MLHGAVREGGEENKVSEMPAIVFRNILYKKSYPRNGCCDYLYSTLKQQRCRRLYVEVERF